MNAVRQRQERKKMTPDEIRNELLKTTYRYGKAHLKVPVGDDISRGEFGALQMIYYYKKKHPDEEGIGAARLAEEVHCSPPAVSRLLRTLEEKGCIVRKTDSHNRRKTRIVLTEKGEALRWKGWELSSDYFNRVTAQLGEEKMQQFLSLWKELVEIMESTEN